MLTGRPDPRMPDLPVTAGARTAGHASLWMNVGGTEVRHGYSMARLHMLARKAALMSNAHAQSLAAKYEAGRSGARGAVGMWRSALAWL